MMTKTTDGLRGSELLCIKFNEAWNNYETDQQRSQFVILCGNYCGYSYPSIRIMWGRIATSRDLAVRILTKWCIIKHG